jgi:hypothetical protein
LPPTFLIFLWLLLGLPSFVARVVLTVAAIYGRRLLRLRRRYANEKRLSQTS